MKKTGAGSDSEIRVVLVTVPDPEKGRELARNVVEEGLAACGNVIPGLTSVYRWEGNIQEDAEAMVLFKTTDDGVEALRRRILDLHGYDVPEVLALPVVAGHGPYLRWVARNVTEAGENP